MTESMEPAWWKLWHWPISIWTAIIALVLLAVPFVVRMYFLSLVPDMAEPFDVAAFVKDAIPLEENAFTDYRRAFEIYRQVNPDPSGAALADFERVFQDGWNAADEATRAWLEANRAALVVWKRGTEKERALHRMPGSPDNSTLADMIVEQRAFLRLARLEQMRCQHEGNFDDAWEMIRAAYRSGGHASSRGVAIEAMIGIALHLTATVGMAHWAEQPSVTSDQLQSAMKQVRSDFALYDAESSALKAEYLYLRSAIRQPTWPEEIGAGLGGLFANESIPFSIRSAFLRMVGEPDVTLQISRQVLANHLREIDKPPAQRRKLVQYKKLKLFDVDPTAIRAAGELDPAALDRAMTSFLFTPSISVGMLMLDGPHQRTRGRQAALEVMFAAHAYQRDQGEFPKSLDQLVPKYLDAVPLDPCDPAGGSLRYRRNEATQAVVWSVGEDGVDGVNKRGEVEAEEGRLPADVGFVLRGRE